MNEMDDLLQERIEQLEKGEPLATCLVDLPEEEVEALRLIATLRADGDAEAYKPLMAAQRAEVLQAAAHHLTVKPSVAPMAPRSKTNPFAQFLQTIFGKRQLAAGLAFLLVAGILLIAFAGTSWWLLNNQDRLQAANNSSPSSGIKVGVKPTEGESVVSIPGGEATPPVSNPGEEDVTPVTEIALVLDPQTAIIGTLKGLVEIQTGASWQVITQPTALGAGQRLRTGALSSATLTFFDGSWTHLGPNSEISIDTLDARLVTDGTRTIALTQMQGDIQHHVATREDSSSYVVTTPAGTGTAVGTQFQVVVLGTDLVQFMVMAGQVNVTSADTSVPVMSGQASTVVAGQPPTPPALFISGEGEVSQMGAVWIIAGQTFQTDANTRISGNPQVGDWVRVEGYLLPDGTALATRIVLLYSAPENRFSLTGTVESIGASGWTIAGQHIIVNAQTHIDSGITVGSTVSVNGIITQDGTLLAESIQLVEGMPGLPFEFAGVVQTMGDRVWTISGKAITLNQDTIVEEGIIVGDRVEVQGWILEDDTWLARSITRLPDEEVWFEITGIVQSMNPWQVSGVSFETREWTRIDEGIEIGRRVQVRGPILPDGTWVAAEIRLLDDHPGHEIEFVGRVNGIDPWIVNHLLLTVNEQTHIGPDIQVGDLVHVRATVQPNGDWLAHSIQEITPPSSDIIIIIEGPIQSIDGNILVILNFTVQVAPDHPILELLEEGDVVRVIGKLQGEGLVIAIAIYNIIGDPGGDITVRIEGPIDAMDGNLILVNGIWLWIDPAHPILTLLEIGTFVSVEGYFGNHGDLVVIIVVHIVILDIDINPSNCYWHEGMGMGGMGMGHWHCGMGMGMGDPCVWHEAMGMSPGHWDCGMGMGMGDDGMGGMGMGNP